jgi:hypothetical protein
MDHRRSRPVTPIRWFVAGFAVTMGVTVALAATGLGVIAVFTLWVDHPSVLP